MNDSTVIALFGLAGVVFAALCALGGTVLTLRQKASEDRQASFESRIADLQSEVDRGRQIIAEHGERIDELESTGRLLTDYAIALRQHIIDGNPPPPPAWPHGLNRA